MRGRVPWLTLAVSALTAAVTGAMPVSSTES